LGEALAVFDEVTPKGTDLFVRLDQITARFRVLERTGLIYSLNGGAAEEAIGEVERSLGLLLPDQVRAFWSNFNGLSVEDPSFQILPLSDFALEGDLLIFGICNRKARLAFDISKVNERGQWFIVNADTRYQITFTMASLWSIHMWSWIVKRRPIWDDCHPTVIDRS
jgi:hypothetical protein